MSCGRMGVSRRPRGKACQRLELAKQGKVGTVCAKCWGQEAISVCSRKFYLEGRLRAESWALRSHSEEFESGRWAEGPSLGSKQGEVSVWFLGAWGEEKAAQALALGSGGGTGKLI